MKPWSRSKVVLVTSAVLWACSGDPTDSFRGSVAEVTAKPTALFIERGQTKQVIVAAVDEQGNPLLEDISISGGSGLTIVEDTTYLQTTTNPQPVKTEKAFNVTANDLTSTSFTVSAGGKSVDVTVKATPPTAEIPAVSVASSGPNASDPLVLTVPAPYVFPSDATVTWLVGVDTLTAIVTDLSADAKTLTVLPPPGVTGVASVSVAVDFIPDVHLPDTTNVPLTINAVVPAQPGATNINTAPDIPISAVGGGLWDAGVFTGTLFGADQYYKFTIPADGTYTISVDWITAEDIDVLLCSEVTCADPDGTGATGDHPETHDYELTAGTYYLVANLFTGPTPPWISISIKPAG